MASLSILFVAVICLGSAFTYSSGVFQWRQGTKIAPPSEPFPMYLSANYKKDDLFYVFMGDTQYWYDCTSDNKNCLLETKCKTTYGTHDQVKACQKKQGEYANRVQQLSVNDVNFMVQTITSKPLSGLIINGDLVMFGNQDEIDRLKQQWTEFFNFRIYPGLGNHDYYTNIDKCPDQECLNRILKYFMMEVENKLKLRMDYKIGINAATKKVVINGSLSYSWDECLYSTCFHFVQLNYYPTYTKLIDSTNVQWQIMPSLTWLEADLKKNRDKPVILNFHAMDWSFTNDTKTEFINFINRMSLENIRILAIMFAHVHEKFGLKETWCFNGGQAKIPLLYSGSVPANNYILAQFSAETKSIKSIFQIHAVDDMMNLVERVDFSDTFCHPPVHSSKELPEPMGDRKNVIRSKPLLKGKDITLPPLFVKHHF